MIRPGAYATHIVVPDARYLIDASGIDEAWAATLACSGLTAYSGISKLPELAARDWVVVLGCGGLGMAAISMLRCTRISPGRSRPMARKTRKRALRARAAFRIMVTPDG